MQFLIFYVQKSFLTKNYFLTAAINLTTRGPLYTCLDSSLEYLFFLYLAVSVERLFENDWWCSRDSSIPSERHEAENRINIRLHSSYDRYSKGYCCRSRFVDLLANTTFLQYILWYKPSFFWSSSYRFPIKSVKITIESVFWWMPQLEGRAYMVDIYLI